MNKIIKKLVDFNSDSITDKDLKETLEEICWEVHAFCDTSCPVFEINKGIPFNKDKSNCICFKNGHKMLGFLRKENL